MLETDRIDLKLDDDHDLVVENGDLQFSSGLSGVVQSQRIGLRLFRGECFSNLDEGVSWLERDTVDASEAILGQKPDIARARTAMRRQLLRAVGTVEVTRLEVAFDGATRELEVTYTTRTVFGDTDPDTLNPLE